MIMRCDGAIDLLIQQRGEHGFEIDARKYIGPESDVRSPTLCELGGTLLFEATGDRLRHYCLKIEYEGQAFTVTDAI